MIRTTPRRRTTLHLSQIFLTLGLTFMTSPRGVWGALGPPNPGDELLVSIGDATPAGIVGRDLDGHAVAGENLDVVLPHSAADRGQNAETVVRLHAKHR